MTMIRVRVIRRLIGWVGEGGRGQTVCTTDRPTDRTRRHTYAQGEDLVANVLGRQLLARLGVRGREHEREDVLLVPPFPALQLRLAPLHDLLHELHVGLWGVRWEGMGYKRV